MIRGVEKRVLHKMTEMTERKSNVLLIKLRTRWKVHLFSIGSQLVTNSEYMFGKPKNKNWTVNIGEPPAPSARPSCHRRKLILFVHWEQRTVFYYVILNPAWAIIAEWCQPVRLNWTSPCVENIQNIDKTICKRWPYIVLQHCTMESQPKSELSIMFAIFPSSSLYYPDWAPREPHLFASVEHLIIVKLLFFS